MRAWPAIPGATFVRVSAEIRLSVRYFFSIDSPFGPMSMWTPSGRLLVGLIEFVTEHGDRNHERADDEVEDIVASHCRTPKDACCDPIPDERWVKSGRTA